MKRTDNTLLSELVGKLLREARKDLKISREELARRAHVSSRLVAELERGQRPNVSLESALNLLNLAGATIVLKAPSGRTARVETETSAGIQRAARVAVRRSSWTGGHIPLHQEGRSPHGGSSGAERLAAVSAVSSQAFLIEGSARTGRRV